jgi:hypothetical protein
MGAFCVLGKMMAMLPRRERPKHLNELKRTPLSVKQFVAAYEYKQLGTLRSNNIISFFVERDLSSIYSPAMVPTDRQSGSNRARRCHERAQCIKALRGEYVQVLCACFISSEPLCFGILNMLPCR